MRINIEVPDEFLAKAVFLRAVEVVNDRGFTRKQINGWNTLLPAGWRLNISKGYVASLFRDERAVLWQTVKPRSERPGKPKPNRKPPVIPRPKKPEPDLRQAEADGIALVWLVNHHRAPKVIDGIYHWTPQAPELSVEVVKEHPEYLPFQVFKRLEDKPGISGSVGYGSLGGAWAAAIQAVRRAIADGVISPEKEGTDAEI